MKLPNAEHAIVDIAKLQDYCLDDEHPIGKHKARVFKHVLGLTRADAWTLRQTILEAVRFQDNAVGTRQDEFGVRYEVDIRIDGPVGSSLIRTSWIIRKGEEMPRLTTCYVV